MNKTSISIMLLISLMTVGCSVKKPEDTSNPEASSAWIDNCIRKASTSENILQRIYWNQLAYNHAVEMQTASHPEFMARVQGVPRQVMTDSVTVKNLDAFKWALDRGAVPGNHFMELKTFWDLGRDWRAVVLPAQPEALPVFMSEATDDYNVKFFNEHAESFKQTGYKLKAPLDSIEFNIRYRRFIGEQLEEALNEKDDDRIIFLIDQTPKVESAAHMDARTRERVINVGNYLLREKNDELLAAKLIGLGFELNIPDLQETVFSKEFLETLRANPDLAVKALELEDWKGPLTDAEVGFILTLPEDTWKSMHKLHIDETIEICIKNSKSDDAMRFIALKAGQTPLTHSDYNELMNWALKYGDKTIFDFVIEQNGDIDIYSIDFGSLAYNQKLFEFYAPKIMNKVYYTLDTDPRTDGTTFGHIYNVLACRSNEKAGLYLISKYDLIQPWVKATKGRTLLMDTCRAGNLLATRFLIEQRGADIHAATGYSELQITMFGRTRPTEGKLTPIFFAAKSGNSELIRYLKSKGANVNARSNFQTTPLMHAVTAGHLESVKVLIDLGADVNARMNPNINQIDLRQMGSYDEISTAYRRAEHTGHDQILNILKQAGARP